MDLYELYKRFNEYDLSLVYFGSFNDAITEKIIDLSETFMENRHLKSLKKKAVFLVTECFQNVTRHGKPKSKSDSNLDYTNAFILKIKNDICYIASANAIENRTIPVLKEKLDYLNQLNRDELHDLYLTVLQDGKFTEKKGASLGLIEMARRTGNKLTYHFDHLGDNYSVFYLMLTFSAENEISDEVEAEKLKTFKGIHLIYKDLLLSRNYLLFKSDFSEDSIFPVIQMIDDNLKNIEKPLVQRKNLFYATVESLQNINHLGHHREGGIDGVFAFSKEEADYLIQSIFELDPAYRDKVISFLGCLQDLSSEGIKDEFRRAISSEKQSSFDLSFTDLARISKKWEYYDIESHPGFPLFLYKIYL